MLGQIEREESSPTIATLWKIARGFEVYFSSFIDDINPTTTSLLHRKGNLQEIHPQDNKIRVMSLFPYDKTLRFEVFTIELLPGCTHLSPPHQSGVVENIIVSHGKMEILLNDTWHQLNVNEGLRFNADQPHGYRNTSDSKTIIYDIIHY